MSLTPQVRVLAAAGCAAMVALMGGYMLLGRGKSSSTAAVPVIKPLHPVKKHVVVPADSMPGVPSSLRSSSRANPARPALSYLAGSTSCETRT